MHEFHMNGRLHVFIGVSNIKCSVNQMAADLTGFTGADWTFFDADCLTSAIVGDSEIALITNRYPMQSSPDSGARIIDNGRIRPETT
jgi:hypothetical protein